MDYNVLRKTVSQCVSGKVDSLEFKIDMHNLKCRVESMGLMPLKYKKDFKSKMVTVDDIFLLSEYYKGKSRLEWFDKDKSFVAFAMLYTDGEEYSEELTELVEKACSPGVSEDKVKALAAIESRYPCINCVVAKTLKPDGNPGINIRFRANAVLLSRPDYIYRHEDM